VIAFLILSPLLVAPVAGWVASRRAAAAGLLALWPAAVTVVLADALRGVITDGPRLVTLPWAPSLGLSLSFHLDGLGLLFALLITGVGALVVVYAARYLGAHEHAGRFFAALFAFMGAMLGVALSDNLLTLFVFWELTGFTSFLLIGFEHDRADARAAAFQALIVTGAGGLALLAGGLLLASAGGSVSLSALLASGGAERIQAHAFYPVATVLVLLAAFTKSAQVPFHFWLPGAMAAPTPVSAYLHSATMVKAGVYLVARMTPILGGTLLWTGAVVAVGAITMAGGAWRAVQETDLKRVLAYSTVSALGALMLLLGLGTPTAIVAALVYLVAHACYKGALFLVAGAIDHETGTRDVTALGGLRAAMPFTAAGAGLAAASMAGVPLLVGFVAKESLYEAVLDHPDWATLLTIVAVGASVLLGVAGLVAGVSPFFGARGRAEAPHEAAPALWGPPLVLALTGLACGIVPALLEAPLQAAAASVLGRSVVPSFGLWHGVTPVLLLSLLTLAAIGGLYAVREPIRRLAWPRSAGADRLFTGTIAMLDATSRAIAPALQSAPLRSYVVVIVFTAATLVGAALATGGTAHQFRVATGAQFHDVLLVAFIVLGALAATRATSSMTAVLSLGVVGYGAALMFLSFGAPDLAMTQFSVETLTVVIFVLVFRHFPRLGVRSPRQVRVRDATIATAFGTVIAALVLFVGTSGTPSRLAGYFIETGPVQAHGRNIVNVILVDFRALDTLGEITVLTTAAIGVLALLRLAAGEEKRS
jgi:multicomponent Na+:H+ antiporter subunit A